MEPTLEAYRLDEHTTQIKDIKHNLHSVRNILVKQEQAWDSVEKNIEQVTENIKSLTIELKDINDRLTIIEKHHIQTEAKIGLLKTIGKNAKWILLTIIIVCTIFNEQISPIVTHFKQQYLGVSK